MSKSTSPFDISYNFILSKLSSISNAFDVLHPLVSRYLMHYHLIWPVSVLYRERDIMVHFGLYTRKIINVQCQSENTIFNVEYANLIK